MEEYKISMDSCWFFLEKGYHQYIVWYCVKHMYDNRYDITTIVDICWSQMYLDNSEKNIDTTISCTIIDFSFQLTKHVPILIFFNSILLLHWFVASLITKCYIIYFESYVHVYSFLLDTKCFWRLLKCNLKWL